MLPWAAPCETGRWPLWPLADKVMWTCETSEVEGTGHWTLDAEALSAPT